MCELRQAVHLGHRNLLARSQFQAAAHKQMESRQNSSPWCSMMET